MGWTAFAAAVGLVYVVALGGTGIGELIPAFFVVNALLAACLVVAYIRRLPGSADRVDRSMLAALLLLLLACALSAFRRQSFDAALTMLTYVSALYFARGLLAREVARTWILRVFIGLSLAMTLLTVVRWLLVLQNWAAIAGPGVLPPLNLELPANPWGHRHDLVLLTAMLYPAWWTGKPSMARRASAVIVGLMVLFLVAIDGSRTLWFALAVAGAITMFDRAIEVWRRYVRIRIALPAVLLVFIAGIVVTGVADSLIERVTSLSSLGFRGEIWTSLVESWLAHPLAGSGPGAFPWILQGTNYFDTNSFAGRHADSAPIQLLAEAGLLGAVALAIILATVVPGILSRRSRAATFALLAFGLASLASNPTDFAFVVAVAVVWTAIALPRTASDQPDHQTPGRASVILRWASFAGALVVGIAYLSTAIAAVAYDRARAAGVTDDIEGAIAALDQAIALDPGMAMYVRQRGLMEHLGGDDPAARRDFARATELNPHDHMAWRSLAASQYVMGDRAAAQASLSQALKLMRSDLTTLLLSAEWHGKAGDRAAALDAVSEVVRASPEVVGSEGWETYISGLGLTPRDVVHAALERWLDDLPSPETEGDQAVWLAALTGRSDLFERALEISGFHESLYGPTIRSFRCETVDAELADVPADARRTPHFWGLRLRNSSLLGGPDPDARWMIDLTTGDRFVEPDDVGTPFSSRVAIDVWGYRRAPILAHMSPPTLPSPQAGLARWYLDPLASAAESGLDNVIKDCVP